MAQHMNGANHNSSFLFKNPGNWTIIGAPLSRDKNPQGVQSAPHYLRANGLIDVIKYCGVEVEDFGDIEIQSENHSVNDYYELNGYYKNVPYSKHFGQFCNSLYVKASEKFQEGKNVLVIGGDHSIATGSISASLKAHPDLIVLWIDAHADINTPETSPSGNYHGMPLAHLSGLFRKKLKGFEWMEDIKFLDPRNVCIIGLRDLELAEQSAICNLKLLCYTMHEIDEQGIGKVIENALNTLDPYHLRPIHMSFDIDSCDPSIAPGTGTKMFGGLSFREARFICEKVASTNRLVSMDLVEVDKSLDLPCQGVLRQRVPIHKTATMTVRLALELIASALGKMFISYPD